MKNIEDNIAVLIKNQFPEFYKEQGENFIEFVKEYYRWSQSANNNIFYNRNLLEYRDVDTTIEEFLIHFKEKYLNGLPYTPDRTGFEVKNALDLYRSKGTERGVGLFFNMFFQNGDIDVYYPGRDVLRASDGEWYVPRYLELSLSEKTSGFIGKLITGSASGATAFCESVERKGIGGKFFDVLYLSNIEGAFQTGDIVTTDGVLLDAPIVIGSMSRLTIIDKGKGFAVGDVVSVVSGANGRHGQARITEISEATGTVSFELIDGGYGYKLTSVPIISTTNLLLDDIVIGNSDNVEFYANEIVVQNLSTVTFGNTSGSFTVGNLITGANSTANVATGILRAKTQPTIRGTVTANTTSNTVTGVGTFFSVDITAGDYIKLGANTLPFQVYSISNNTILTLYTYGDNVTSNVAYHANGTITIATTSGNFANATIVTSNSSPAINATAISTSNTSATGVVTKLSNNTLGIINATGTFLSGHTIFGLTSNSTANVTLNGSGSGASFDIGSIKDIENTFINTDIIGSNNVYGNSYPVVNLNSVAYGFLNLPSANLSTVIDMALTYEAIQIGSIQAISGINPGSNYNVTPVTVVKEESVAKFDRKDIRMELANATSNFAVGEQVTEEQTVSVLTLNVTGGNVAFTAGGLVTQNTGVANVYGKVVTSNTSQVQILTNGTFINSSFSSAITGTVTANSTNTLVVGVGTSFSSQLSNSAYIKFSGNSLIYQINSISNNTTLELNTFGPDVSANTVTKLQNGIIGSNTVFAYSISNTESSATQNVVAKGIVLNGNSQFLEVRRKTLGQDFYVGGIVTGAITGATANVVYINEIQNSLAMGENADVFTEAGISDGAIAGTQIINSGYAYEQNEIVTLVATGNPETATAKVNLINQGEGEGYFTSTKGFLNDNKYIHDGKFYQEYSYQIRSEIPLDFYADALKHLMHVAGTRLFGSVVRKSIGKTVMLSSGVDISLGVHIEPPPPEAGAYWLAEIYVPFTGVVYSDSEDFPIGASVDGGANNVYTYTISARGGTYNPDSSTSMRRITEYYANGVVSKIANVYLSQTSISIDANDNIYVAGVESDDFAGPSYLRPTLIKYDTSFNQVWKQRLWNNYFDDSTSTVGTNFILNNDGSGYLVTSVITGTSPSFRDTILLSCSNTGTISTIGIIDTYKEDDSEQNHLATDNDGALYVGITRWYQWGDGSSGNKVLIYKYTPTPSEISWTTSFGGYWEWPEGAPEGFVPWPYYHRCGGIAYDKVNNRLYALINDADSFYRDEFNSGHSVTMLVRLDPTTGARIWETVLGIDVEGYGITTFADGTILISGSVTDAGNTSMLLAKFDSDGNLLWTRKLYNDIGGVAFYNTYIRDIATKGDDIIFTGGIFKPEEYSPTYIDPIWTQLSGCLPANGALTGTYTLAANVTYAEANLSIVTPLAHNVFTTVDTLTLSAPTEISVNNMSTTAFSNATLSTINIEI